MRKLEINICERFLRSRKKESMAMQLLAVQAIHEFELRYNEDPVSCIRTYDRIEGTSYNLLEMKISGGRRIVAHWSPGIIKLFDVGGDETTERARQLNVSRLLLESSKAPDEYHCDTHNPLIKLPAKGFQQYANELSPEWLYHLDPEQTDVLN